MGIRDDLLLGQKEANTMQTRLIRTTITITAELATELDEAKKTFFHNESHANMYRYLLRCGLDQAGSLSNPNITSIRG